MPEQPISNSNLNENNELQFSQNAHNKTKGTKTPLILLAVIVLLVAGYFAYRLTLGQTQLPNEDATTTSGLSQYLEPESNNQEEPSEPTDLAQRTVEQDDLPPVEDMPVAVQDSRLFLTAEKETYKMGEAINLTLLLAATETPDGIQFVINYDPTLLSQVKLTSTNTFGDYIMQKVDSDGKIKGMLLRNPQETVDVSQPLSLMTIAGVASRSGQLTFSFNQEETQVAAAAGQDILENALDLSLTIE